MSKEPQEQNSVVERPSIPVRADTTVLALSGAVVLGLGYLFSSEPAQTAGVVVFVLGCLSQMVAKIRGVADSATSAEPETEAESR